MEEVKKSNFWPCLNSDPPLITSFGLFWGQKGNVGQLILMILVVQQMENKKNKQKKNFHVVRKGEAHWVTSPVAPRTIRVSILLCSYLMYRVRCGSCCNKTIWAFHWRALVANIFRRPEDRLRGLEKQPFQLCQWTCWYLFRLGRLWQRQNKSEFMNVCLSVCFSTTWKWLC